jgi:hypothetical protein
MFEGPAVLKNFYHIDLVGTILTSLDSPFLRNVGFASNTAINGSSIFSSNSVNFTGY